MAIYFGTNKIGQLQIGTTNGSAAPVTLQQKSVNPTESQQIITPDSGYTGLSRVTIGAINSNYIGSNIARRTGTDITVSGNTVTVPIGYFAAAATASVATATHANPTATINTSTGLVTASHTQAAGYVTAGTTTGTLQLTVQAAKIVTPTTSEQTAVAANRYTTGVIKVGAIQTETKSITENGTYTPSTGKYFSSVTVNVSGGGGVTIYNQDKTVTPTTSQQSITADSGYTGLGTVTVNAIPTMTLPTVATASATSGFSSKATIGRSTADQYINIPTGYNSAGAYYKISGVPNGSVANPTASKGTVSNHQISVTPSVTSTTGYITGGTKSGTAVTVSASELVSGNKDIDENGTNIDVTNYATVSVNVPSSGTTIENQDKTITPTESQQSVTADSGYTGLGTVTVNAISSTYVGSGITQRSSTDLTVSGATITAPAGYYSSAASKSVISMTLPTAVSSSSSGTNKATIGRSTSNQYINIPVGYNSTAAYYTISAVANGSATPPATISGTNATVSTGTNTLTLTQTLNLTPQVTAGYISAGTAANRSVSLRANVTTKAAATITPGTSNQTIASGTYLTGTQTISGDANLIAGNIKSGISIFGVTGSYEGSGGGSGTSKNAQFAQSTTRATSSSYTELISLTCSKAGTYNVYWSTFRSSTSGTWGSQLYLGTTAYGSAQTGSWSNHIQNIHLENIQIAANQKVSIRVRTRGSNYYGYVGTLTIIEQ